MTNIVVVSSETGSQWLAESLNSISSGRWWNGLRYQLKLADCWTFRENSISTGFTHGVEVSS